MVQDPTTKHPLSVQDVAVFHQESTADRPAKLVIAEKDDMVFVAEEDILYIEGNGSYSNIVIKDGRKFIVSKNIKAVSENIQGLQFMRTHKSYLVNLDHVKKYVKTDGGGLLMPDKKLLPISRDKISEVMKYFKKTFIFLQ
ncbi:MAG: LytTR family transcriptional regulator [Cytophagaceae bacterium]|jgi:two-component system LytT family response regulator|nr:LytTR family transcriptional regulator [Cytophagaceae bacterium]